MQLDHVLRVAQLSHGGGYSSPAAVQGDLSLLVYDVVLDFSSHLLRAASRSKNKPSSLNSFLPLCPEPCLIFLQVVKLHLDEVSSGPGGGASFDVTASEGANLDVGVLFDVQNLPDMDQALKHCAADGLN